MEIFPSLRFASLSLTIVYVIFALVAMFVISTFDKICTVSVLRRDVSTIFASAMASFSLLILSSR